MGRVIIDVVMEATYPMIQYKYIRNSSIGFGGSVYAALLLCAALDKINENNTGDINTAKIDVSVNRIYLVACDANRRTYPIILERADAERIISAGRITSAAPEAANEAKFRVVSALSKYYPGWTRSPFPTDLSFLTGSVIRRLHSDTSANSKDTHSVLLFFARSPVSEISLRNITAEVLPELSLFFTGDVGRSDGTAYATDYSGLYRLQKLSFNCPNRDVRLLQLGTMMERERDRECFNADTDYLWKSFKDLIIPQSTTSVS